jgi:hypothetical protein
MKKNIFLAMIFVFTNIKITEAQELFSYTEPASNMAANSLGIRITNTLMKQDQINVWSTHMMPEVMWGVSRKLMIHTESFLSAENSKVKSEGGAIYLKYRFFSIDEVHSHFRIAAFGRYAFNNSEVHQSSIDLNGHNTGFEMGLVSTKLINKVALSSSVSFLNAQDNSNGNKFIIVNANNRNAINYTFSIGKLMIPKEYVSYNQTNINAMVEVLGQANLSSGTSNLDIAPVIQFIIKSKMRIDFGYRIPLSNQLYRENPEGGMVRFEYNFFNVLR